MPRCNAESNESNLDRIADDRFDEHDSASHADEDIGGAWQPDIDEDDEAASHADEDIGGAWQPDIGKNDEAGGEGEA